MLQIDVAWNRDWMVFLSLEQYVTVLGLDVYYYF